MTGPIVPMLAAFIAAVFAMPASGATTAAPAQQVTTLTYVGRRRTFVQVSS
jgi:hypothetical protein